VLVACCWIGWSCCWAVNKACSRLSGSLYLLCPFSSVYSSCENIVQNGPVTPLHKSANFCSLKPVPLNEISWSPFVLMSVASLVYPLFLLKKSLFTSFSNRIVNRTLFIIVSLSIRCG